MFSIEINLAQNLTKEEYIDLANEIEDAIAVLNCPVTQTYEDGTTEDEDLIQSVSLVERTEITLEESEEK